ncbi:HAMP domain-containing sensor histidine kinase [Thermotoga sp.]|uniref:sensor histidine kinase n=1 Tax=Thermotoga sp. TaxID=28240 RepID=UPI0025FF0D6C|nr:HAMP domain-containing sensor histidine kinase [Thermotoga sp.]MCD6551920.1 HAMP domain-containing histidine kinase [Thermotoga sp.]
MIALRTFLITFLVNAALLSVFWSSKVDFIDVAIFSFFSALLVGVATQVLVSKRLLRLRESISKKQPFDDFLNDEITKLSEEINTLVQSTALQEKETERLKDVVTGFVHDVKSLLWNEVKDENLQRIVEEFYEFAKLEAGIERLRKEPVNLVELVNDVVERFPGKVSLEYEEEVTIQADPTKLFRAFYNLIENAVKYSSGCVEVFVSKDRVVVKGPGPEIPYEVRANLFEKKKKSKGTGIGLYLVRELLEMHGFRVIYRREGGFNIFEVQIGYTGISSVKSDRDSR